jgi:hypothetical protein
MRESGVRSSCETLASSSRSLRTSRSRRPAISSNATASSPTSSRRRMPLRVERSPSPSARAARVSFSMGATIVRTSGAEAMANTTRTPTSDVTTRATSRALGPRHSATP